jgi:hypothetical protein
LVHLPYRFRGQFGRHEQHALEQGTRRMRQHELLVPEVVPDLHSPLAALEDEVRRRGP